MCAALPCGQFIPNKALVATFVQDVAANTEAECLAACLDNADCEAVSFKTGNRGGCWLRKDVTGLKDDDNKDSYILCENERRDFGALHHPRPPLSPLNTPILPCLGYTCYRS